MISMSTATRTVKPALVALLALSCGVAVANLYYAQPLLATIATSFHTSSASAATVVTVAQVGYGLGLALLVPLGDIRERRRVVPLVLVATTAALVAAGNAPDIAVLAAAAAAIGFSAVVAQILVPFAAQLAGDAERGRVVGTVMSGLLIGILLARTVAGVVAELAGWRAIYLLAAGWVALLAVVLWRTLPAEEPRAPMPYRKLLASVIHLVRAEPVLRRRSLYGLLTFACFNILWTSLSFLLAGPPYHYSNAVIGLFGLLGAGGAVAASVAGRLSDRGLDGILSGVTLAVVAGSFGLLALGRRELAPLIAGVVLLDLGAQGTHLFNQSHVFRLDPAARSRLNTAYMVAYFVGGSLGSLGTGLVYDLAGWAGVCILGSALGTCGFAAWLTERPWQRYRGSTGQALSRSALS